MKIRESEKLRVEVYKNAGYACASVPVAFVLHSSSRGAKRRGDPVHKRLLEDLDCYATLAMTRDSLECRRPAILLLVKEES